MIVMIVMMMMRRARLRQTRHDIANLQGCKKREIAEQGRDRVCDEGRKPERVHGQEQCRMDMGVRLRGRSRENVNRGSSRGRWLLFL